MNSSPNSAVRFCAVHSSTAFSLFLCLAVVVYFGLTVVSFTSENTAFAIMERFAVSGLISLALTLCIIAGEIDLSVGSNAALSAVVTVMMNDPLGTIPALLCGVGLATLIGALQGYAVAVLRIRAIVLTVGTLMLLRGIALYVSDEKTVMLTDFEVSDFIQGRIFSVLSPASLFTVAFLAAVALFLAATKYGREIYAIGGARREAVAAGINLKRPMTIVFLISGFCAGTAGAIIGLRSGTAQALGLQQLLLSGTTAAFVGGVSILGGRGGVLGAIIGALTINAVDTGLVSAVTPAYIVQIYLGALLVAVVLFQTGARLLEAARHRRDLLAAADRRHAEWSRHRPQTGHADNSNHRKAGATNHAG